MPEPVSNSSRFDPSQDWCSAELEEPPVEPEPDVPDASEQAPEGGLVLNLGFTLSAQSVFPSAASPVSGLPGGAAVAAGIYVDIGRLEVGTYERVESRWSAGSFAGGGAEFGITADRSAFDGESISVFAEGGPLGRFGYSVSATGLSVGVGLGEGAAAGAALGETETEPVIELGRLLESSPALLRRGP